jgi:hypothetical protein
MPGAQARHVRHRSRQTRAPFLAVSALAMACTGVQTSASGVPPADGRCGVTPRMIVSATTYPLPTDAGPVTSGVGPLIAAGSDLYYAISVVPVVPPGFGASYFDGSLLRVPKTGGEPTSIASAELFLEFALTTSSLLVADNADGGYNLLSIPLAGGPTAVLTHNGPAGLGLASDGRYAYFGTGTSVQALPLEGDATAASAITIMTASLSSTLAVVGDELVLAFPQGEIAGIALPPKPDAAVTMLGMAGVGQEDMVPCGSDVCWLSEGPIAIWRMNPVDGQPVAITMLSGPFEEAHGLVFDGSNFYLSGSTPYGGSATLGRVSGDGSRVVSLVNMQEGGAAVTVDDECVYWANSKGIFSLAKTAGGPFDQ